MKTLLTRMTTATLLSMSPVLAAMAGGPDCVQAPVTSARDIAAAIDHEGHAMPVVVFQRGTANLAPASRAQIAELVDLLNNEPELHIQLGIAAHDDVSPELARERVRVLRTALLDEEIPADRVAVREVKAAAEVAKLELGPGQCAVPGAAGS